MTYMQTLIDRAAANVGSRYKLAKALNVAEESVARVFHGERPLPMEWLPDLVRLTGDDFGEAFRTVANERAQRRGKVRAASSLVANGAAAMHATSGSTGEGEKASATARQPVDRLHIVSILVRAWHARTNNRFVRTRPAPWRAWVASAIRSADSRHPPALAAA
jgi:hypothetical protein